MNDERPKLTVITSSDQKAMGIDLMDELRAYEYQRLAREALQAIAEAEKQEPVAECVDDGEGGVYYKTLAPKAVIGKLYTHPQQKAEQEPEAAPVAKNEGGKITWMIDDWPQNCLLYTHPQPKREPLTNSNPLLVFAKECVLGAYSEDELADAAFKAIESAHGIKGEA